MGNNPIKYVDPDGRLTFKIGGLASAGAGVSGSKEYGIMFGFSKAEGFTFGYYTSSSIGAEYGVSVFLGIIAGIDFFSPGIQTGESESFLVGGSFSKGFSIGGDLSYDLKSGNAGMLFSFPTKAQIKLGPGEIVTAIEGHTFYSITQTHNFIDDMKAAFKELEEGFYKYILKRWFNLDI